MRVWGVAETQSRRISLVSPSIVQFILSNPVELRYFWFFFSSFLNGCCAVVVLWMLGFLMSEVVVSSEGGGVRRMEGEMEKKEVGVGVVRWERFLP